jgi:hypothetical protein
MKRHRVNTSKRAWLGGLLLLGSIALIIALPSTLTFVVLLVAGLSGMWMLMAAIRPY